MRKWNTIKGNYNQTDPSIKNWDMDSSTCL